MKFVFVVQHVIIKHFYKILNYTFIGNDRDISDGSTLVDVSAIILHAGMLKTFP